MALENEGFPTDFHWRERYVALTLTLTLTLTLNPTLTLTATPTPTPTLTRTPTLTNPNPSPSPNRLRDGRSEHGPPLRTGPWGGELADGPPGRLQPAEPGAWSFDHETNRLTLKPGATHLLVTPLRTMVVGASCVS